MNYAGKSMPKLSGFKCEECPSTKTDPRVNGWFRARAADGAFEIRRWDGDPFPDDVELYLCSESCAAKAMSKAIGAGQGGKT